MGGVDMGRAEGTPGLGKGDSRRAEATPGSGEMSQERQRSPQVGWRCPGKGGEDPRVRRDDPVLGGGRAK